MNTHLTIHLNQNILPAYFAYSCIFQQYDHLSLFLPDIYGTYMYIYMA